MPASLHLPWESWPPQMSPDIVKCPLGGNITHLVENHWFWWKCPWMNFTIALCLCFCILNQEILFFQVLFLKILSEFLIRTRKWKECFQGPPVLSPTTGQLAWILSTILFASWLFSSSSVLFPLVCWMKRVGFHSFKGWLLFWLQNSGRTESFLWTCRISILWWVWQWNTYRSCPPLKR